MDDYVIHRLEKLTNLLGVDEVLNKIVPYLGTVHQVFEQLSKVDSDAGKEIHTYKETVFVRKGDGTFAFKNEPLEHKVYMTEKKGQLEEEQKLQKVAKYIYSAAYVTKHSEIENAISELDYIHDDLNGRAFIQILLIVPAVRIL